MSQTTATWVRPLPGRSAIRADALLAAALAFAMLTTTLLYQRSRLFDEPAEPWVWAVAIALCTAPLALRRRYPAAVAVLVAIGFFITGQFRVPEALMSSICLFLALYTVGAWGRNRAAAFWTRLGITAGMIVWLLVNLVVSSADQSYLSDFSRSGIFSAYATYATIQIITNLLYFGAAFLFGERAWRGARLSAQLEAQGRELELERQTSATQAVALDRLGIARELHDVVAHHVSVMGIQAAAARRSLETDPQRAVAALEVVESSAHAAVEELRRLVHTLRTPENEDPASTIGVAQLAALVAESQRAGTPATLIVSGEPRPLPMLVDVALYRTVQEALTNVRKHAGRGAVSEVRLRFRADAAEVEIADNGVRQTL
ncbi:sensor histidine kinase, partial [Leucobacter soli]